MPDKNMHRAALEAVRKDANDPTLSVGDTVFCRGVYATVTEINRLAPGTHDASPIRNDWAAVQVVTDNGARWHGVEPEPSKIHIHVGSNIPGYLPESDVGCFDDRESAIEFLKQELKGQQDYYYEQCEAETPEQQESGSDCCGWCSVALDVEAALSTIADSGPDKGFILDGRAGWIFRPPEGPDVYHWAVSVPEDRESCEIAAEQDGE